MNKTIFLQAVIICVPLMFQGCTNLTMLRTQELRSVKSQVDSLKLEIDQMQQKIVEEQKNQTEILRLLRADLQIRFNELDRKVSTIDGNLSENQFRLTKIDEKTAEFNKKLEAKLTADSSINVKSAEVERFFQVAMSDFNAGRYDVAVDGFRNLSIQFPESAIAQEAEYWIAECYYAAKKYTDAEKAYLGYIKKFPQGSKICVSLYKIGLVYQKQNKEKHKNMAWKKLVEQCPDSQEAKVVKAQSR